MAQKKNVRGAVREPAGLPPADELEPGSAANLNEGGVLRDLSFTGLDLGGAQLPQNRIFGALFERVSFAGAVFSSAYWQDARFVECDLSNASFHALDARRVEFAGCRMTGLKATGAKLQDVLFENCDMSYAALGGSSFETCEFDGSNLNEADMSGTRAGHCVFASSTTLDRADLRQAQFRETDLRGAAIGSAHIEDADLKTCTITPAQAIEIARLMGFNLG